MHGREKTRIVYCGKCGTQNPDDAKVCTQCGASLYPGVQLSRRYGLREEECLGLPKGGEIVSIILNVIIILVGYLSFLVLRSSGKILASSSLEYWSSPAPSTGLASKTQAYVAVVPQSHTF